MASFELVKSPGYEWNGEWRVVVDGETVGSVVPHYVGISTKRWMPHVRNVRIASVPYRTVRAAAVEILLRREASDRPARGGRPGKTRGSRRPHPERRREPRAETCGPVVNHVTPPGVPYMRSGHLYPTEGTAAC